MAELQKVYMVKCETCYTHIEGFRKKKLKSKTDFINQFPTHEEVELCLKKHNEELERIKDVVYSKLNADFIITEFLRYVPTTLEILAQNKSLHNEYASLFPDAKTISSEEQKLRDELKKQDDF